jgi:hypothetical protein
VTNRATVRFRDLINRSVKVVGLSDAHVIPTVTELCQQWNPK